MIVSLAIIAFSVVLFGYWFRYSCMLILSARTTTDFAYSVVEAYGLNLPKLQTSLENGVQAAAFDSIVSSLDLDYARVRSLIEKAPGLEDQLGLMERVMLRADYALMRSLAVVGRTAFPEKARESLLEMCSIVGFLADAAGSAGVVAE